MFCSFPILLFKSNVLHLTLAVLYGYLGLNFHYISLDSNSIKSIYDKSNKVSPQIEFYVQNLYTNMNFQYQVVFEKLCISFQIARESFCSKFSVISITTKHSGLFRCKPRCKHIAYTMYVCKFILRQIPFPYENLKRRQQMEYNIVFQQTKFSKLQNRRNEYLHQFNRNVVWFKCVFLCEKLLLKSDFHFSQLIFLMKLIFFFATKQTVNIYKSYIR